MNEYQIWFQVKDKNFYYYNNDLESTNREVAIIQKMYDYSFIKIYYNNKLVKELYPASANIVNNTMKTLRSIVSISFGVVNKTYDYLLTNKSGQRIIKDQKIKLITGSNNLQEITIKHLNKYGQIPKHVTKQLIVTSPTTAIVGFLDKGGTT